MRSEKEMMELILSVARKDERIRAVYMNGSRTNPNVKKDIFQDYDIVYVVKENRPFYEDERWIDRFGERLYMQCPEKMDKDRGQAVDLDQCFGWLMQFQDGNRLDLHVVPVEKANVMEDKLCVILLDKDHILPSIQPPTDEDYWIRKPSEPEFLACANEFWWCLNNVAKGLWREEIPYVHAMYTEGSHAQLLKMLNWKVGYENGFCLSTGKASKYLKDYLPEDLWGRFLKTYITGDIPQIWDAMFIMCDLFQETATELGGRLGYAYNIQEAEASYQYVKQVRTLPKDAKGVF